MVQIVTRRNVERQGGSGFSRRIAGTDYKKSSTLLTMCEGRGERCAVQTPRHALLSRHDVDADPGEIVRGRHVRELLQPEQAFRGERKRNAERFNDAQDSQRRAQRQRDKDATASEVGGNELKEVRDGESVRLGHDQRACEALSERKIDGLAEIVDMDGLEDGPAAAKNRHDPGPLDESSHLREAGVLAGTQDQTGPDDEVFRGIEEEFERPLAPAIVRLCAGMGGRARNEDEP